MCSSPNCKNQYFCQSLSLNIYVYTYMYFPTFFLLCLRKSRYNIVLPIKTSIHKRRQNFKIYALLIYLWTCLVGGRWFLQFLGFFFCFIPSYFYQCVNFYYNNHFVFSLDCKEFHHEFFGFPPLGFIFYLNTI